MFIRSSYESWFKGHTRGLFFKWPYPATFWYIFIARFDKKGSILSGYSQIEHYSLSTSWLHLLVLLTAELNKGWKIKFSTNLTRILQRRFFQPTLSILLEKVASYNKAKLRLIKKAKKVSNHINPNLSTELTELFNRLFFLRVRYRPECFELLSTSPFVKYACVSNQRQLQTSRKWL